MQLALDLHPIELQGFKLRARSVVPVGTPSLDQLRQALAFAHEAHESAPYWIGHLLVYAESRKDWHDKLDQVIGMTGLALKTIHNYTYLVRHVDVEELAIAPSPAHAAEVAPLPKDEQRKFLARAKRDDLTRREMRQIIKAEKRPAVIDGQAELWGKYRVIYADPPWEYRSASSAADGAFATAGEHYPTMTIADMCKMPIAAHALKNAVLFLWTTAPHLLQNPGPREVLEAWGFTYKTNVCWDKVLGNFGHYFRVHHEHLIIATRGSCLPDEPTPQPDSVQVVRRSDVHSEKPDHFRTLIEKLYTQGPYLELFGRKRVEGWTVVGNDARLWPREMATA